MSETSVDAAAPPRQDDLVPASMNRFHQWTTDGIDFELWADHETGFILANPQGKFEVAGQAQICGDRMSVNWQGAITKRPQPWLNAQRAIAHAKYAANR